MEAEGLTLMPGAMLVSGKRNYKVVCVLGSGGFGVTYLAKGQVKVDNVMVEGLFAVKELFPRDFVRRVGPAVVPNPERAGEFAKSKEDFILEATRLQKIGTLHDNIVKVNEIFEANGTAYYVMQYVNGESLYDYVAKYGALNFEFAISLLSPVLNAVEFLHENRINHFDIKPDNIMLQAVDEGIMPVLIDFGLSIHFKKNGGKTTPRASFGLSEGYAPIEQYAEIDRFSPQTDVYALAATLYYMLTNETPAAAPSLKISELRSRLLQVVPERIADAICRAMAKTDDTRTPSVARFREELLGQAAPVMPPVDAGIPLRGTVPADDNWIELPVEPVNPPGRKWLPWVLAGVFALIVAVSVVLYLSLHKDSDEAEPQKTDSVESVVAGETVSAGDTVTGEQETPAEVAPAVQTGVDTPAAAASSGSHPSSDTASHPAEPDRPQTTTGSVSVGNGTYTGALRDGKPHGKGRVAYNAEGRVAPTVSDMAYPGYVLEGYWTDGMLESGSLYDETGKKIKTIIP